MRCLLLMVCAGAALNAANPVTPGRLKVERPTLIALGFEWQIEGDDNRNAVVEASYRKTGEGEWRPALPLLRLGGPQTVL